jgi:hypothetical protein
MQGGNSADYDLHKLLGHKFDGKAVIKESHIWVHGRPNLIMQCDSCLLGDDKSAFEVAGLNVFRYVFQVFKVTIMGNP